MSYLAKLQASKPATTAPRPDDPPEWLAQIADVRGYPCKDGMERLAHRALTLSLDAPAKRGREFNRLLSDAMRAHGWKPAYFTGAVHRATGCRRGWERPLPSAPADSPEADVDVGSGGLAA
ncbi:hypothetical protein LMIY3S_04516 [Labrys miyagiensis]